MKEKHKNIALIISVILIIYIVSIVAIANYNKITGFATLSTIPYEEKRITLYEKQSIGTEIPALTETDFDALESRFIITPENNEKYCQKIMFVSNDGSIQTGRAETKDNSPVLRFVAYNSFFDYEFGLCDMISGRPLKLKNIPITILGQQYSIIKEVVSGRNNDELELTLIGDPLVDWIEAGDKKQYPYLKEDITVSNLGVFVGNDGKRYTELSVAGEVVKLSENTFIELKQGLFVGVLNVQLRSARDDRDATNFYVGTNILTLKDDNFNDNTYMKGGAFINGKHISDSSTRIMADYNSGIQIKSINYRLRANAESKDVYLKVGDSLRQKMSKPEGLITDWDMLFDSYNPDRGIYNVKITFGDKTKPIVTSTPITPATSSTSEEGSDSVLSSPADSKSIDGIPYDEPTIKLDYRITILLISGIIVMLSIIAWLIIYIKKH